MSDNKFLVDMLQNALDISDMSTDKLIEAMEKEVWSRLDPLKRPAALLAEIVSRLRKKEESEATE